MNSLLIIQSATSNFSVVIVLVIFALAFVLISTERLPNAITAMVGAFLMVVFQILNQEEAIEYIDFDTIGLLCGMMLTVAVMRKTGIFEFVAIKGIKLTKGNPWKILIVLSLVTAVLSAFLDNVTTVLIIVPLTFAVADTIKINPIPILVSEVLFSNIGGAATLIGDPPNIMIGGATHLEFMDFINVNLPAVIVVSVFTIIVLRMLYYKKLNSLKVDKEKIKAFDENRAITNKPFLWTTLVVFGLIMLGFITQHMHHIHLASIALGGGFMLMMVTKQDPEEILKEVEWTTLFFFIGLFIIIGGLDHVGIITKLADKILVATDGDINQMSQFILWLSGISTSFVNSIPYTAIMISVIENISAEVSGNVDALWWALSLGACLGGNGTLVGAAANIIVTGFSQKTKYPLKFKEYIKVGFPLMFMSIIVASVYLYIRFTLLGT
jgi:Na+/H+ antiporter NhaD/arsenite permease-like protein